MKKKILIGSFLLLVLVTAIIFCAAAIDSYNYDMDPANRVDILQGFEAVILMIIGGLVVLCEIDLFFTVYYFLIKPITMSKSIFMILSQLMLLLVIFSNALAHFLYEHVSEAFGEEGIVIIPILVLYIIQRLICIFICIVKKTDKTNR